MARAEDGRVAEVVRPMSAVGELRDGARLLWHEPAGGAMIADEIFGSDAFDLFGGYILNRFREVDVVGPITHGDRFVDLVGNRIGAITPVNGVGLND